MVIKSAGMKYDRMKSDDMVVANFITGEVLEGDYNPFSDTVKHIELYRVLPSIGGITHAHSINSVTFAQAGMDIPALGNTHADYFYGAISCTRKLMQMEVKEAYEINTGKVIIEIINNRGIDSMAVPGVVVKNHGPFAWGKDAAASVYHAVVMGNES